VHGQRGGHLGLGEKFFAHREDSAWLDRQVGIDLTTQEGKMDEQNKPEQSEDVEAHIRPHHNVHEEEGPQDEQEKRPNHLSDDDDVEAHSMADPEHRFGPGKRYEPGKRY
jgi:hypothetical protein